MVEKITALKRFVSKSTDKCFPFFKLLQSASRFTWDDHCQQAFKDLKEYLTVPPLLVSPEMRETLYLYLAASKETMAVILIRKTPKRQFSMYYVSKTLHSSKLNYKKIEKLMCVLLMAS